MEEHLPCILSVMRRNRELIRAARLEWADVYQQLALRLIWAVDSFDPAKGTLKQHIYAQLRFELMYCKTPLRRYGLTDAPPGLGRGAFVSYEAITYKF